jgi:hypothetical protein
LLRSDPQRRAFWRNLFRQAAGLFHRDAMICMDLLDLDRARVLAPMRAIFK